MDREKIIRILEKCAKEPLQRNADKYVVTLDVRFVNSILELLKEQAVKPRTIPEELKQKMWNALYIEEDKLEEKYIGTDELDDWLLIYRPWLQNGFDLVIKVIADWEDGEVK